MGHPQVRWSLPLRTQGGDEAEYLPGNGEGECHSNAEKGKIGSVLLCQTGRPHARAPTACTTLCTMNVDGSREEYLQMLYACRSRGHAPLALLLSLLGIFYGCGGDGQAKKAAHMQRGEAYVAKEKYEEDIIEFSNAVKLDPQDATHHYQLALAYLKQGGLPQMQAAF